MREMNDWKLIDEKNQEIADQKRQLEDKVKLIKFTDKANSEMSQEIAELKAQLNEFRAELQISAETFSQLDEYTHPSIECDAPAAAITELLDKTPAQALQTVKADVIKKLISDINIGYAHCELTCDDILGYLNGEFNKVREGES